MRGYPEHLHEVINEELQESIYDETLGGCEIRDSKYSLEIMKQELENKYINPEILYAFKASIQALEKQIAKVPDWEGPWNDAKDDAEVYCPECDYYFKDETSYCPDCGQKILWP